MKARIKPKHMFSKHIRDAADEYVRDEVDKAKRDELYRFLKVFFVTLNEEFKFGHDRLMKLLLIDRLGLPFEREDYEEREKAMLENARRY